MSERFERWNDHSCTVKDNQENTLLNWEDVVDLLNEQQATIQSLKEDNEQLKKEYKIAIDEMVTDYKKLEKENEMLRILLKDIYVDDELRKLAERYGVENE